MANSPEEISSFFDNLLKPQTSSAPAEKTPAGNFPNLLTPAPAPEQQELSPAEKELSDHFEIISAGDDPAKLAELKKRGVKLPRDKAAAVFHAENQKPLLQQAGEVLAQAPKAVEKIKNLVNAGVTFGNEAIVQPVLESGLGSNAPEENPIPEELPSVPPPKFKDKTEEDTYNKRMEAAKETFLAAQKGRAADKQAVFDKAGSQWRGAVSGLVGTGEGIIRDAVGAVKPRPLDLRTAATAALGLPLLLNTSAGSFVKQRLGLQTEAEAFRDSEERQNLREAAELESKRSPDRTARMMEDAVHTVAGEQAKLQPISKAVTDRTAPVVKGLTGVTLPTLPAPNRDIEDAAAAAMHRESQQVPGAAGQEIGGLLLPIPMIGKLHTVMAPALDTAASGALKTIVGAESKLHWPARMGGAPIKFGLAPAVERSGNLLWRAGEAAERGGAALDRMLVGDDWIFRNIFGKSIKTLAKTGKIVEGLGRFGTDIGREVGDIGGIAGRRGPFERAGRSRLSGKVVNALFGDGSIIRWGEIGVLSPLEQAEKISEEAVAANIKRGAAGAARAKALDELARVFRYYADNSINGAVVMGVLGAGNIESAADLGDVLWGGAGIGMLLGSTPSSLVWGRRAMEQRKGVEADVRREREKWGPATCKALDDAADPALYADFLDRRIAKTVEANKLFQAIIDKGSPGLIDEVSWTPAEAAAALRHNLALIKSDTATSKLMRTATAKDKAEASFLMSAKFMDQLGAFQIASKKAGFAEDIDVVIATPDEFAQHIARIFKPKVEEARRILELLRPASNPTAELSPADKAIYNQANTVLNFFASELANTPGQQGGVMWPTDTNAPGWTEKGHPVQRPLLYINADTLAAERGQNIGRITGHEMFHVGLQFKEFQDMVNKITPLLFDQWAAKADGTQEKISSGLISDEELLGRLAEKYAAAYNHEDPTYFLRRFEDKEGVIDQDKLLAAIKEEWLAENFGLCGNDNVLSNALENTGSNRLVDHLRLADKATMIGGAREWLKSKGIIVDNSGRVSDILGELPPEALAAMRRLKASLWDYNGSLTLSTNFDINQAGPIPLTKIASSKALFELYKDADWWEREAAQTITAPDGTVVKDFALTSDAAKALVVGNWVVKNGIPVPADDQTLGEPSEAMKALAKAQPDGSKIAQGVRVRLDTAGNPKILSKTVIEALARQRDVLIKDAFDNAEDDGTPNRLKDNGNGSYFGVLSPSQAARLAAIPDIVLPPALKSKILRLNDMIRRGDGSRFNVEYQPVYRGGKARALSPHFSDDVPIGFKFTKAGNFLVTTISVSRLVSKLDAWAQAKPERLNFWNGSKAEFWSDFVRYLDNWKEGKPGETSLSVDPKIAVEKKHILNDFLNLYNKSTELSNPDRTTLKTPRGQDSKDRIIVSRRVDRMLRMDENAAQKLPINYGKAIANALPQGTKNDRAALWDYINDSDIGLRVNRFLRAGRMGDKGIDKKYIEDLIDKMDRTFGPIEYPSSRYRYSDNPPPKVGEEFNSKAYLSTTVSEASAKQFSRTGAWLWEFKLPAGFNESAMRSVRGDVPKNIIEHILPRGSSFIVESVDSENYRVTVVPKNTHNERVEPGSDLMYALDSYASGSIGDQKSRQELLSLIKDERLPSPRKLWRYITPNSFTKRLKVGDIVNFGPDIKSFTGTEPRGKEFKGYDLYELSTDKAFKFPYDALEQHRLETWDPEDWGGEDKFERTVAKETKGLSKEDEYLVTEPELKVASIEDSKTGGRKIIFSPTNGKRSGQVNTKALPQGRSQDNLSPLSKAYYHGFSDNKEELAYLKQRFPHMAADLDQRFKDGQREAARRNQQGGGYGGRALPQPIAKDDIFSLEEDANRQADFFRSRMAKAKIKSLEDAPGKVLRSWAEEWRRLHPREDSWGAQRYLPQPLDPYEDPLSRYGIEGYNVPFTKTSSEELTRWIKEKGDEGIAVWHSGTIGDEPFFKFNKTAGFDGEKRTPLGVHFGTREQAEDRFHNVNELGSGKSGQNLEESIKDYIIRGKFLRVKDIADDSDNAQVMLVLHDALPDFYKIFPNYVKGARIYAAAGNKPVGYSIGQIRGKLKELGYSGLVYDNEHEAIEDEYGNTKPRQDSYLVFEPKDIKELSRNSGKFGEGAMMKALPQVNYSMPNDPKVAMADFYLLNFLETMPIAQMFKLSGQERENTQTTTLYFRKEEQVGKDGQPHSVEHPVHADKVAELKRQGVPIVERQSTVGGTPVPGQFLPGAFQDKYQGNIDHAKAVLYPRLKEEMLSALRFAMAAELRHALERTQPDELTQNPIFQQFYKYHTLYKAGPIPYTARKPDARSKYDQDSAGYKLSYDALRRVVEKGFSWDKIARFAYDVFTKGRWAGSYGGIPWGNIAKGYTMLSYATTPQDMAVAIDHVYDLQHNTDTVFNKLKRYYKGGYSWIAELLNLKADAHSVRDLLPSSSSQMRKIALPVLRDIEGVGQDRITTLENFAKQLLQRGTTGMTSLAGKTVKAIKSSGDSNGYQWRIDVDGKPAFSFYVPKTLQKGKAADTLPFLVEAMKRHLVGGGEDAALSWDDVVKKPKPGETDHEGYDYSKIINTEPDPGAIASGVASKLGLGGVTLPPSSQPSVGGLSLVNPPDKWTSEHTHIQALLGNTAGQIAANLLNGQPIKLANGDTLLHNNLGSLHLTKAGMASSKIFQNAGTTQPELKAKIKDMVTKGQFTGTEANDPSYVPTPSKSPKTVSAESWQPIAALIGNDVIGKILSSPGGFALKNGDILEVEKKKNSNGTYTIRMTPSGTTVSKIVGHIPDAEMHSQMSKFIYDLYHQGGFTGYNGSEPGYNLPWASTDITTSTGKAEAKDTLAKWAKDQDFAKSDAATMLTDPYGNTWHIGKDHNSYTLYVNSQPVNAMPKVGSYAKAWEHMMAVNPELGQAPEWNKVWDAWNKTPQDASMAAAGAEAAKVFKPLPNPASPKDVLKENLPLADNAELTPGDTWHDTKGNSWEVTEFDSDGKGKFIAQVLKNGKVVASADSGLVAQEAEAENNDHSMWYHVLKDHLLSDADYAKQGMAEEDQAAASKTDYHPSLGMGQDQLAEELGVKGKAKDPAKMHLSFGSGPIHEIPLDYWQQHFQPEVTHWLDNNLTKLNTPVNDNFGNQWKLQTGTATGWVDLYINGASAAGAKFNLHEVAPSTIAIALSDSDMAQNTIKANWASKRDTSKGASLANAKPPEEPKTGKKGLSNVKPPPKDKQ